MINERSKSICQLLFISSEQVAVLKFISNCVRVLNGNDNSNELAGSKCKQQRFVKLMEKDFTKFQKSKPLVYVLSKRTSN